MTETIIPPQKFLWMTFTTRTPSIQLFILAHNVVDAYILDLPNYQRFAAHGEYAPAYARLDATEHQGIYNIGAGTWFLVIGNRSNDRSVSVQYAVGPAPVGPQGIQGITGIFGGGSSSSGVGF